MADHLPDPETSGALVPPPRVPPVAVATSAPLPPRRSSSDVAWRKPRGLTALVTAALDGLDALGDRIAGAAGLR